jgi:hypothetical protein
MAIGRAKSMRIKSIQIKSILTKARQGSSGLHHLRGGSSGQVSHQVFKEGFVRVVIGIRLIGIKHLQISEAVSESSWYMPLRSAARDTLISK